MAKTKSSIVTRHGGRNGGAARRGREPLTLRDLLPDPVNARKHGARNIDAITAAVREVGVARSIVIDEAGVILAGNATVLGAKEAGVSKLHVIDVDGETLVAVRRSGLSKKAKARLALYDNRAAELAEGWDVDILKEMQAAGIKLDGLWSADELVELFGGAVAPGLTSPDATPAVRATSIQPGHVFQLGRHRLVCGDCTDAGFVNAALDGDRPLLMVTDPPYGVEYAPEWRTEAGLGHSSRMGKVENDDRADWREAWALFPGDVAYVYHAGIFASVVEASLASCSFQLRAQIIWRKPRIVLSRGHYHWQHEPCWYAVKKGRTGHWAGKRNQATVWPIQSTLHQCQSCGAVDADSTIDELPATIWDIESKDATGETTHGTQKPVECMSRAMRNHKAPVVYEPFSGSGTSIIAAEMLGRSCRALELSPAYVQQAIDRWEAFTGSTAIKVGEAHGAKTRQ